MSILSYNGGAIVAMKGDNCVAIASDLRFGIQAQTLALDFEKVFEMGPHMYLGLPGLATDTLTVRDRLKFRLNLYELRESRKIHPKTFAAVVSNMLYEKRFGPYFVELVIASLDPKTFEPYVCNMDLIGCINEPEDFVVAGSCTEQLYGMCEALWEPNLKPDALFETCSQALVNAFDRDAICQVGEPLFTSLKRTRSHPARSRREWTKFSTQYFPGLNCIFTLQAFSWFNNNLVNIGSDLNKSYSYITLSINW